MKSPFRFTSSHPPEEIRSNDSNASREGRAVRSVPPARDDLIHDWNDASPFLLPRRTPLVLDETLRDGLQSASARDPSIGEKLEMLHYMAELGIDCAAIGIPCTHPRQFEDALRLAKEIADQRLAIKACCAARTRIGDIEPIVEISQRAGIPIEVGTFIGSSPLRQYVEGWDLDRLDRLTAEAVSFARENELPVLYVTEDTTRSTEAVLRRLYRTAIRSGAQRLCIADTAGHATPTGAGNIVRFAVSVVEEMGEPVGIDWHGHRDRGFELANCFAAWAAGAERCHGTALGVGERAGNTPIELLLVNLRLEALSDRNLHRLCDYVAFAARALNVPVPAHAPVTGADAFRTATGVHASAMVKAAEKGDAIDERIYSSVRASMVGRETIIDIGPMSGEANVRYHLSRLGLEFDQATVDRVLAIAKQRNEVLSEVEIFEALGINDRAVSSGRLARNAGRPGQLRPASGAR
jgi:2-isopropylmalate synthase